MKLRFKSDLPTVSLETWMISGLDLTFALLLEYVKVSLDTVMSCSEEGVGSLVALS